MSLQKNIFGPNATQKTILTDGTILLDLEQPLFYFPEKITEKLKYWANNTPDKPFISQKKHSGVWQHLSFKETLEKVENIAQFLLNQGFKEGETIVILSENSLEHALLALAALYVGIPYSPISQAYSLVSNDFGKLKHCLELMTPKLVFAQDGKIYEKALSLSKIMFPEAKIVTVENNLAIDFAELINTKSSLEVEKAFNEVKTDDVAKILFTSGSTGLPKGVINTHKMWCANLQQITQMFPFMETEPPVFIDWLPWNHTFGGNHNFGLALYNGGTLFIDEGKPTSKGIENTVQNLREISPTVYFNVPKGFEMLIPFLENEPDLRKNFFKNLHFIFYAGASLAQPIWNRLEELSIETTGKKIPIITGLGCTESGPSAMFANWEGSFSGLLGVPVAGMQVKLIQDGDKREARYKAPNVTIGYWRDEKATQNAFDEEGYYKTGDAVKFLDEEDPNKGLVFDGRIAEDFKLSTGTWVNVGILKAKVIAEGSPIVQDVVIAGLDKEFVSAILFLNIDACRKLTNHSSEISSQEVFQHHEIQNFITELVENLGKKATGSATRIVKAIIAHEPPSIDLGEITDKGSLNQRAILKHRAELVEEMYLQKL
jgi:feruloyl-CoA synthase